MDGETGEDGLLDADRFLRVSESLRLAFERIAGAEMDPGARDRWQRRLISITNVAKRDLTRAEEQLDRFHTDFDEQAG